MEKPRNTAGTYKVGLYLESKQLLETMKKLADDVSKTPALRLSVLREIRLLLVDIDNMDDRRKKRNMQKPRKPLALMAPSHRKRIEELIKSRQEKQDAAAGTAH